MSKDSSTEDRQQEIDTMIELPPDINMHTTTTTTTTSNSATTTISNIGAGGEQQLTENGNGDLFMGDDDDSDDKNWKPAMDEIDDGIANEAKTRWDTIEPSPTNLNKLDGWLKKGHSNREDNDYHAPVDDRGQGKKPRRLPNYYLLKFTSLLYFVCLKSAMDLDVDLEMFEIRVSKNPFPQLLLSTLDVNQGLRTNLLGGSMWKLTFKTLK